jgi:hypothetical protein
MEQLSNQIHLALRTAAGHARAANDVEEQATKQYEMKMRSAGASVYEAWGLAVRAQPEYQGRQLDDAALERIFKSNKPRPWWDRHLEAVKVNGKQGDREWASRTLQWHTDLDGARARRAALSARLAARHKTLKERAKVPPHGVRTPRAPTTREMKQVLQQSEQEFEGRSHHPKQSEAYKPMGLENQHARDSIRRRLERVNLLVGRMSTTEQLAEAEELVRGLVDALEEIT